MVVTVKIFTKIYDSLFSEVLAEPVTQFLFRNSLALTYRYCLNTNDRYILRNFIFPISSPKPTRESQYFSIKVDFLRNRFDAGVLSCSHTFAPVRELNKQTGGYHVFMKEELWFWAVRKQVGEQRGL